MAGCSRTQKGVIVTIEEIERNIKQFIVKNKIERINICDTFRDFFEGVYATQDRSSADISLKVYLSSDSNKLNKIEVDDTESFHFAADLLDIKFIDFIATKQSVELASSPGIEKIAFNIMMQTLPKTLNPLIGSDMKTKLHNDVISKMQSAEDGGPLLQRHLSQDIGHKIVKKVTDAIWYLDGRSPIITGASKKRKAGVITSIPTRFEEFSGYQNWQKWKKKPRLDLPDCEYYAGALISAVEKPGIKWPTSWKNDLLELSSSFSTYAVELNKANTEQQLRQSQFHPIRQIQENASAQYCPSIEKAYIHKDLCILSNVMEDTEDFTPVLVEDEHFSKDITPSQKYYLLGKIALAVPVQVLRYDSGGGASLMVFLQKVPALFTEDEKMTMAIRMLKKVEPDIPVFHTRAMRKAFTQQIGVLHATDIKPHVLRHVYRTFTGDSSSEVHDKEIDERIKLAIETNDPDLVIDLRHLNKGRPADTFDVFFKELGLMVEQVTAADDRRHGVAHMSQFISVRDMIAQVIEKLPPHTPIPSESTVLHAFAPPNIYSKTSQYYVGKINLKHMVQRRQLRAFHVDAHWCNALYKYLREMAVKDREKTIFVSCDDKAKIDFGEPGYAISSGVRGEKSIVPTTTTLGSLDHDVNRKGNIIPTVMMLCDIPAEKSDSFYRGHVNVALKESVFQPSCSYRAIVELMKCLEEHACDWSTKKQLFLFTDGGPEHRVCFESVKIPLIMLFKKLNLDLIVAIRTAPGHSYVNIVERIMSIVNLGLQNTALERAESESDPTIKKCSNLEDLRKKKEIKADWQNSVQPVIKCVEDRLKRLTLKDVPFKIIDPATDDELGEFIEATREIDEALPTKKLDRKLSKADLKHCKDYHDFLKDHCHQSQYASQIRNSNDIPWLPFPVDDPNNPGHYKTFDEVYGEEPDEKFLPSNLNNFRRIAEEQQGCKSSTLTAQNVRGTVTCTSCKKPRCIYAKRTLTNREVRELHVITKNYDYVCGCIIAPESSMLQGTVFARLEVHCKSSMEFAYYGASKISVRKGLCAHCGKNEGVIDKALKELYKTVLPICRSCRDLGNEPIKKAPVHTAAANKSRKAK